MRTSLAVDLLHRTLRDRGLSQADAARLLSERLGRKLHQSTVAKTLRGHAPRPDLMVAYFECFGVPFAAWAAPADQLDDAA